MYFEVIFFCAISPFLHRCCERGACESGGGNGFGRKRAQCACQFHRLVFGEGAAMTVESLVVWTLFECIFRYTAKVLETFVFGEDAEIVAVAPDSIFLII